MKVLGFILFLIFSIGALPAAAQNYSPDKQCRILIKKKRYGNTKRKSRRYRVAKNTRTKSKTFEGAERESTAVASKSSKKATSPTNSNSDSSIPVIDTERTVASTKKSKRKNSEPEKEEVSLMKKDAIIFSGQSQAGEKEAIQKEVTRTLAEIKDGETIHLDPVYLKDNNGQLEVVNMKPVLMAAEYGKKGRQVSLNGHMGSPEETTARIARFKQMLVSMGVSPDLISTEDDESMASSEQNQIDFTVY